MQSFPPSEHTKLMNLSVMLGYPNSHIRPLLLENGYPLRELGLRIPIPGFNPSSVPPPAPTPDVGYSSTQKNAVLFLEAKGGGTDDDQTEKFLYVQQHPESLLATRNKLGISENNLVIDFVILCSNFQKISEDHARNPIPFPILHYNEQEKYLTITDLTGAIFINSDISETFTNRITVTRLPLIYLPFSSYDYPNNLPYLIQKIVNLLISRSGRLDRHERLPAIEEIIKEDYPLFRILGAREYHDLIETVKIIMNKLFPDDDETSTFNIKKYMSIRNGKMYLKRTTIKKFSDRFNSALYDFQSLGFLSRQSSLFEFEKGHPTEPDIYTQIERFFDPTRIFERSVDED